MRRANGTGGVMYLGKNRRRPFVVRITEAITPVIENGKKKYKPKYKNLGYFETREEAEQFLDRYLELSQEDKKEFLAERPQKKAQVSDLMIEPEEKARLATIFKGMKERCYNPDTEAFRYYGAKGVKVCDEWLDHPVMFYLWSMSHGYMNGLSIDRIDPRGDYEPSNCRWTDSVVQGINRRAKHDDCYTCMFRNSYINNLHATCYERVMELREKNISEEESESC